MVLHPWDLVEVNNSFYNNGTIRDWPVGLADFLLAFLLAAKVLFWSQVAHGATKELVDVVTFLCCSLVVLLVEVVQKFTDWK